MNPDNYGSLPACKKLAEVLVKKGIEIETEAVWALNAWPVTVDRHVCWKEEWQLINKPMIPYKEQFPAYSMPEVWRELREYGPCSDGDRWWLCDEEENTSREVSDFNPADALIELWIWVLAQEEASHD